MPDQPPTDPLELAVWSRDTLAALVDTLRRQGPDKAVWTFGPEPRAAFWYRRMAHETSIHRWDGETAASPGAPRPIDPELAADGIDEVIAIFLVGVAPPTRLRLEATDVDGRWTVAADADGELAVTGSASDLLLFLWGRARSDRLTVTEGDAALLDRWQDAVEL